MCWMCENPGATYEDVLDHMRQLMLRHGWALQYVGRDGRRPPYAYTLGLTDAGLSELVVTGLSQERSARILNEAALHFVQCEHYPGDLVHVGDCDTGECRELEVVRVANPEAHLNTATALFGIDVRALQLVWPDDRGRWPWHPWFRANRGGQPVLGPRAVTR